MTDTGYVRCPETGTCIYPYICKILCKYFKDGICNSEKQVIMMNEKTGNVVPYDEIPEKDKHKYSEPFKRNDIIVVKGLNFRITRWDKGRLFLKLVKKK